MSREAVTRGPASFIILDGAYSARPEISDLIDLAVLVDVPTSERHRRIAIRETDKAFLAAWHARWDAAEDYYFTHVRPAPSFDLVVAIST
jgi:uridine kinase